MKLVEKQMLVARITFTTISIGTLIAASIVSCVIANEGAPCFLIVVGMTAAFVAAALVFGVGELIVHNKENGVILDDIRKQLKDK